MQPTLENLLAIAVRDLGAKVSFVTEYTGPRPLTQIGLLSFMLELSYALKTKAKHDNQDANGEMATKPYSSYAQDVAFAECQRTACLVDEADELVMDLEDALFDATRGAL